MKRGILILAMVFVMVLRPSLTRAETHVYVSFSVGGAVVIGAGVVYWGFSYTSQVSERKSPEENPNRRSVTAASASNSLRSIQLLPILMPQPFTAEERTRADFSPAPEGPRAASSVEVPLLIFRW
jgi:hypothetical protein